MLGRELRWGLREDCTVLEEAADPRGCFQCLLLGHWILSRFVFVEVMGAEESRFDRHTAGPELVDRGLIGGW